MPNHRRTILFIATVILFSFAAYGQSPSAPDSTLYTTYTGNQTVYWTVCGSTQQTEGCYASGILGSFGFVGAIMESQPVVNGNVVTRAIYVVDTEANGGNGVVLDVYKKIDTVSASTDTVTVALWKTVNLPTLAGGGGAICFMAANRRFLFIGTSYGGTAVEVSKSNFAVTSAGAFNMTVSAITADPYGYVTITQGNGFAVYGPDGSIQEDGGGSPYMLNDITATSGASLFSSDQPQRQVGYWSKK